MKKQLTRIDEIKLENQSFMFHPLLRSSQGVLTTISRVLCIGATLGSIPEIGKVSVLKVTDCREQKTKMQKELRSIIIRETKSIFDSYK